MPTDDLEVLCEAPSTRARTIATGAVRFLKTWPTPDSGGSVEFFGALLALCLVCAAFVVLTLVPLMVGLGRNAEEVCAMGRSSEDGRLATNVYFLKHENRTWTTKELCHVETAARRYPDYNIFLINLVANAGISYEHSSHDSSNDILEDLISLDEKNAIILRDANTSSEETLRYELSQIPNIHNVDIGVDQFFSRSMLWKKIHHLSSAKLELAAKYQLLWDHPGIAVEPLDIHQLASIRYLFDKINDDDVLATIQIDADLQAASVPCQTFVGHVLREMTRRDFTDRRYVLNRTLVDFCSSLTECDGVRIVKPIATRLSNFTTCPTTTAANVSVRAADDAGSNAQYNT